MFKPINREKLFAYTGDVSQLFYARRCILQDGKAEGIRAADINSGAGLEFTVLADRCMDIGRLSYKAVNCSYISKAGLAAPGFYNKDRVSEFSGGFLTTCGLRNVGVACDFHGEHFTLHGTISSKPAEDFCVDTDILCEPPKITAQGKMRDGEIFGVNLWLTRTYTVTCGENRIHIRDNFENRGIKREPFMILYHFNFGYPLLDEYAKLYTSCDYFKPRDEWTKENEDERYVFSKPVNGIQEQCYYYKQKAVEKGRSFGAVINERLGMGVALWAYPEQLPNLNCWKNPGSGDYVLGVEPSNCWPDGAATQEAEGTLQYLEPMEVRETEIEIELIEGERLKEIKDMSKYC